MCSEVKIKTCLVCDKVFEKKNTSKERWESRKYCSMTCYDEGKKGNKSKTGHSISQETREKLSKTLRAKNSKTLYIADIKECIFCGVSFNRPKTCKPGRWINVKCCSRQCRDGLRKRSSIWEHSNDTKICLQCNQYYNRPLYKGDEEWSGQKFCSNECRHKGQIKTGISENEIIQLLRKKRTMADWRTEVFIRDNFTCQNSECGKRGCTLNAHHIVTIKTDKTKAFDINNGITLCVPCHYKTYGKEEQFEEKYNSIVQSKLNNKCSMYNPHSLYTQFKPMGTII